jgi:hypothetical protein
MPVEKPNYPGAHAWFCSSKDASGLKNGKFLLLIAGNPYHIISSQAQRGVFRGMPLPGKTRLLKRNPCILII